MASDIERWENEGGTWIDLPEEITQRMYDVVTAVAHGHESMFLMAEAVHIIAAIDRLANGAVESEYDIEEDEE